MSDRFGGWRWTTRPAALPVGLVSLVSLIVLVMLVVLVSGCTGVANLHIPTPPSTAHDASGSTTTVSTDLSGVVLPPLGSTPPTAVVLTPGAASLSGVIIGPAGPAPGAIVLVERLVGDSVGGKLVPVAPDGTWKLPGIRGGRYRVRAWRAPDLAMTTPQILLLGAKDNQNINLTLMAFNGQNLTASLSPSPPLVGQVTALVIQATQQTVGSDGVVRGAPLPGANVFAFAAGTVVLAGTNPGTTDAGGRLVLSLGCSAPGPVGLSANINSLNTFSLMVPDCAIFIPPPVTTTTTVTPPPSSVP
jgi:uncharacterized protein YceK